MITVERARELLNYDPETGVLTWKVNKGRRVLKGRRAASINMCTGYRQIGIDGRKYREHRIIWLIHYGFFPDEFLDHLNHDRADNRLCNLRATSRRGNSRNVKLGRANKSGVMGVQSYRKSWRVMICSSYYGSFKTIEEAAVVAKRVYAGLGYHENHGATS